MSGFCGLIYKHPVPAGSDADFRLRQQLAQLMRGVASRGPHASDSWVSGRVGLGHNLLREVPEAEREAQPLTSADGKFVIVFDGRIDNRDEIFANIDSHLRPRLDCPDVEIVLAAHRCWADDAPKRLLGDFAYAVWDTAEQLLVAVRDPLAGRPFYYVDREDFFAFASHDEALLSLPGVSANPNEDHVANLFILSLSDYDQFASWYSQVNVLHPAFRLCLRSDGAPVEFRYWNFPEIEPRVFASDNDALDAFESVLNIAVSARLRTYGPPAMLLSGGIDSASVVTSARLLLGATAQGPIRTYSAMSDDEAACVESQAIRTLIDAGPCAPSIVRTPSFEGGLSPEALRRLVWGGAHPIDNSLVIHMPLFTLAAADGATSVLNGVGGDVVTSVAALYPSQLIRQAKWRAAWQQSGEIASNHTYFRHLSQQQIFTRSLMAAMPEALKGPLRRKFAVMRIRADSRGHAAKQIFTPDFWKRLNLDARIHNPTSRTPLVGILDRAQRYTKSLDWLAHGQIGYDRLAGRFGVASRDVWSDLRVVKMYSSLPLVFRTSGGWTKSLVRSYLSARGLSGIAERTDKQNIGGTFTQRLMAEQDARLPVEDHSKSDVFRAEVPREHDVDMPSTDFLTASDLTAQHNQFLQRSVKLWRNRVGRIVST